MTCDNVESMIIEEIRKMEIILDHMIMTAEDCNEYMKKGKKKSHEPLGSTELKKILHRELKTARRNKDYTPLKFSMQQLIWFWLENIVNRNDFINKVLDDVYRHMKKNPASLGTKSKDTSPQTIGNKGNKRKE